MIKIPHTFSLPFAHWSSVMDAEFKFHCSHCDQPLKCAPARSGEQVQCPPAII